jgi:hypothetical protein
MPGPESKKRVPYSRKPRDMSLDQWQAGLRKQTKHIRYPSGIISTVSITVHARLQKNVTYELEGGLILRPVRQMTNFSGIFRKIDFWQERD